jgi:hypothetical protein
MSATLESDLCYYDPRNPDYDPDNGPRKENCKCDSCFYGRHGLVERLILTRDTIYSFLREHDIEIGGVLHDPTKEEIQALRQAVKDL